MVSKAELRKLNKEQLVNMVYDLLIRVDNLVAEVQILKKEAKVLKAEIQDLTEYNIGPKRYVLNVEKLIIMNDHK